LTQLGALNLPLIRLMIERDWRIRDHGSQAHDAMFRVSGEDNHKAGVLIALRWSP
jgi:hypothetical protein